MLPDLSAAIQLFGGNPQLLPSGAYALPNGGAATVVHTDGGYIFTTEFGSTFVPYIREDEGAH